jgi:hypothetical protein
MTETNSKVLTSYALVEQIESVDSELTVVFKDKEGNIHCIDPDVFVQVSRKRVVLFEENTI